MKRSGLKGLSCTTRSFSISEGSSIKLQVPGRSIPMHTKPDKTTSLPWKHSGSSAELVEPPNTLICPVLGAQLSTPGALGGYP